jgi:hypothetical protein
MRVLIFENIGSWELPEEFCFWFVADSGVGVGAGAGAGLDITGCWCGVCIIYRLLFNSISINNVFFRVS